MYGTIDDGEILIRQIIFWLLVCMTMSCAPSQEMRRENPCESPRHKELMVKIDLTQQEQHEWDSLRKLCDVEIQRQFLDGERSTREVDYTQVILTGAVLGLIVLFAVLSGVVRIN